MSWMALTIGSRQWPALTQNRPEVASITLVPSGLRKCMPLAPANMRGFFLKARLAVKGTQ